MIRAVVSDFGGVLTLPVAEAFLGFCSASGIEPAAFGAAVAAVHVRDGRHPLHELECGRITQDEFMALVQAALSESAGREIVLADFAETMWAGLRPNPPMVEFMTALRGEGYRMALLTNNVREWAHRWRTFVPIDDIFEVVVDSAFVGIRKPDAEIYELTAQRLGVAAHECVFIDDARRNVEGAAAVGMRGVVYRDAVQAIAEIRAALNARPAPGT